MTEHEQDSKFTKNKRQDGENKMDIQEWIIFAIELIGTVAFSASGAMVGIDGYIRSDRAWCVNGSWRRYGS